MSPRRVVLHTARVTPDRLRARWSSGVARALFPDPPRRIRGQRLVGVVLRTVHIAAFATLLGGHVFSVDPPRLVPFLLVAIASGAGLMTLELASTFAWLFMVKGAAVVVKLLLLAAVPLFWEHRVALLMTIVMVASFAAHLPSRVRHYSLLERRTIDPHHPRPARCDTDHHRCASATVAQR